MFKLKLIKTIGITSLLFWLSSFSVWATIIYTWVDESGVVHYSQQSPENIEATKIYSEDLGQTLIGFEAPKIRATSDPEKNLQELNAQLVKQKDAEQAKTICDNAKHSLKILSSHGKLNRKDPKTGKTIAMTAEEQQTAIKENKERISLFCEK